MKKQTEENNENIDELSEEVRPRFYSTTPKKNNIIKVKLDKINEKDEDNYISNLSEGNQLDENIDEKELILNLKNKILELEEKIIDLKTKNDSLKKDNIETDSKLRRMSFIGNRKNFNLAGNTTQDSIKIANLIKEKNDLQEINEKMLNMLTEKELKNEELQENFDLYKKELKSEIQKYLDTIEQLEEKNEILEENIKNQENLDQKLNDVLNQYNSYKKRIESSIMEYIKKEEEMKKEIDDKEYTIIKMKNDIQSLELKNIQLQNQTEKNEKMRNEDINNFEEVLYENDILKNDNNDLMNKMKQKEEKIQIFIKEKEEEIKNLNQEMEISKNNFEKIKEEKNNEINLLKNEISKCNRDISILIKKNDSLIKEGQETKKNIYQMQNKLDKKTKELQEINESAKKLLENKENIIKSYEKTIEEINKEKTELIEQNHDLLDKVRNANSSNLGEILNIDDDDEENENDDDDQNYENLLLKAEIKTLKEQLENQAHDLLTLSSIEKEVSRLRLENEKLDKDNKTLKKIQKYGNDNLMSLIRRPKINKSLKKTRSRKSFIPFGESFSNEKQNVIQITNIKINDDKNSKPDPSEELKKIEELTEELDKLKEKSALLKVQFLNREFENESAIAKYKGIIKSVTQQCEKMGFSLNIDLDNL